MKVIKVDGLANNKPAALSLTKEELAEEMKVILSQYLTLHIANRQDFSIDIQYGEKTVIFNIKCTKEDIGRVLGKGGKMVDSLRYLVAAVFARHHWRAIVEVPYFQK